jgi:NhaC family Na+:H+ antiporter
MILCQTKRKKLKLYNPPSLLDALIPTIILVILLAGSIILYGDAGIEGPIQVALILTSMVAMAIGFKNGHTWAHMGRAAVERIASAMGAIFILFGVGALVGT